jgi:hypothetical protein
MATTTESRRQQLDRLAIKSISVLGAEVRNASADLPDSSCNVASNSKKSVAASGTKSSPRPFLMVLEVQLDVVEERLKCGTQTEAKVRELLATLERLSTASGPELKPYTLHQFALLTDH